MNRDLRIVYMGTPDFAVLPLKRIVEAGYNVVGVVTNPDKPAGRGRQIQESPVKVYAKELGLPILQPEKFRDPLFLEQLAALKADLQLVVAFKMLPQVVWSMPKYGTMNLHASMLPDYRGAAPINWAIMNGDNESGVSTFILRHEIDTGAVLFQQAVPISETMTAGELHDTLMEVGADLLLKSVDAIDSGDYKLVEQDQLNNGHASRHAPKIFKEDMKIDWSMPIYTIYNKVRGLSPFPAAWFELKSKQGEQLISAKVFKVEMGQSKPGAEAGTLCTDGKTYMGVHLSDGTLYIKELQIAGKRRMGIEEFLRGFNLDQYEIKN